MVRTVPEHRHAALELLTPVLAGLGQETVPLERARERVLAVPVIAPGNLPPFANSQMDGYAVRAADLAAGSVPSAHAETGSRIDSRMHGPARLAVAQPIPAGASPAPLHPGFAAPIMTGAMLPDGADAVVPIEAAEPDAFYHDVDSNNPPTVALPAGTPAGQYVRPAGSDIAAGTTALPAGAVLGAAQLGLLAALGLSEVAVRRRPTVLLLTTGDEVVPPGSALAPGQIHDANTTLLRAALQEAGAVVHTSRPLADAPGPFLAKVRAELTASAADLILTTGGISKGAYEVVRQALAETGEFVSVAMQPGGPQGIGSLDGVPFLGFPGNPVSALISFEMFLRPVLASVTGYPRPRPELSAVLTEELLSPPQKYQVRRGSFCSDGTVRPVGGPGSHLVHALAEANALIHLPAGVDRCAAGDSVRLWLVDSAVEQSPAQTETQPETRTEAPPEARTDAPPSSPISGSLSEER